MFGLRLLTRSCKLKAHQNLTPQSSLVTLSRLLSNKPQDTVSGDDNRLQDEIAFKKYAENTDRLKHFNELSRSVNNADWCFVLTIE